MDFNVIKIFAQVAGLGGLSLVLVLYVFRGVIQKDVFSRLTKHQSYRLFCMIIIFTSIIAVVGMGAWVYVIQNPPILTKSSEPSSVRVSIFGSVKEKVTGTPIHGVNISADHFSFRAISNADGSFAESFVLPKLNESVTLRAFHKNYKTRAKSLTIEKEAQRIDITMEKRQ